MREAKYKFINLFPDKDKINDLECLKSQNRERWTSKKQRVKITIEILNSVMQELKIKVSPFVQVEPVIYNDLSKTQKYKLKQELYQEDDGIIIYKNQSRSVCRYLDLDLKGIPESPIELEYIQIFAQNPESSLYNEYKVQNKQLPIELDENSIYKQDFEGKLNFIDRIKQTRDPAGRQLNKSNGYKEDSQLKLNEIIKQSKLQKMDPDEQLKKVLMESEKTNKEEEQKRKKFQQFQQHDDEPVLGFDLGYTENFKNNKQIRYDYSQINTNKHNEKWSPQKLGYTGSPQKQYINQKNSENKQFKLKFQDMKHINYFDLSLEFRQFYEQLEQIYGVQYKDKLRQMINK